MDEIFWQESQQYTTNVGHQPTDAEIDRMIDELEEEFEGDEYVQD